MKKILLILVAIFSVGVFVAAADNDKLIDKSKLPVAAQQFINAHFAGVDLVYAKEECRIFCNSYEVRLADGAKLEFSSKGDWEEVDCQSSAVPADIVPKPIRDYVEKNYADEKIVVIEKNRNDYEVKLSNRLELKFDKDYNIYDIDD
ncbi:MAG: PepSY-like domain-containing protein [Bacteroidaceae bacterium]|nr:PepSY-like domain-containing protein [Bacteroidaceae bacterium]